MDNRNYNNLGFSEEILSDCLQLWSKTSISLIDIRRSTLFSDEYIRTHRISANTFFFTLGTQTEVCIDDTFYSVERFGIFHGGKGSEITIRPIQDYLECYMLLYKTSEPLLHKNEYMNLLAKTNPFRQQYGFAPENPLFFMEQLRKMLEAWKKPSALNIFYSKSAFYQFVYEVYRELLHGNIQTFQPDTVETIKRYISKHYNEPLGVQSLADFFGISTSQLGKLFKKREGKSPQEFLIETRLQAVMTCLSETNANIREIAMACGFGDEFSLSKQFRSRMGMTPSEYRRITTNETSDFAMFKDLPFSYNEVDRVSLGKLKGEGANTYMFNQFRNKAVMAAALTLVMMLSACGTVPASTNQPEVTPSTTVVSQESKSDSQGENIRQVSVYGENIEVPDLPQRVLVNYYIGDILALGVPLAAVYDKSTDLVYYDLIKNLELFSSEWDSESVMQLDPDIIIDGTEVHVEKYSYTGMAPVVIIPWNAPLEERLTIMGDVFGCEDEAAELIANYNERVEEAKALLQERGILNRTITVFEDVDGAVLRSFGDITMGRGTELFYEQFGMTASPRIQDEVLDSPEVMTQDYSLEVIPEYAGEIIVHVTREEFGEELAQNPVWQAIPAVKAGNVIEVPFAMFGYNDILTTNYQLEYFIEQLLELPIAQK